MTTLVCSRCLLRTSNVRRTSGIPTVVTVTSGLPSTAASFSTSASLFKSIMVKSKKNVASPNNKGAAYKGFKRQKGEAGPGGSGKRPAIGERKAFRKRVVLSNTNALPVKDLEDFSQEIVTDEASIGKVVAITDDLVDRLRAVEAFKPRQGWSLFSRPAMVVRPETVEFGKLIESTFKEKKVTRRVFVGERATGKSVMLLQAMAMAMLRRWVVINIPEALDLTIASTEYAPHPSPNSIPLSYTQPAYTAKLLLSISRANPILQTLRISRQPPPDPASKTPPIPAKATLATLCQLGAENPPIAWDIFQLLLSELKQPDRPPILFAIDGLGFAMRDTKYIDATQYKPIHAHDFTLIETVLSHLSGKSPLPNGGVVLAAVSESNRPNVEALNVALDGIEGRGAVTRYPYARYDERVMSVFEEPDGQRKGVEVQRLGGLGKVEARALMEYWAKSGIIRAKVGATEVAEKWGMAGGGVVGELERVCFRGITP